MLEELELIPQWPLIALGREGYNALSYMFPRRTIIGLPHPTGQGGRIQFSRFMPGGILLPDTIRCIRSILSGPQGGLEWISDGLKINRAVPNNRLHRIANKSGSR
jgi:hypothetical protein